ncbi:MAG: hypothetical protein LBJ96_04930, partial [Holosporaceae bacterium]|nr:hypothetical protein [Holosporaceae bacterium]
YLDPCIATKEHDYYNRTDGWVWGSTDKFAQIKAYNFFATCYGLTKNAKFLMTVSGAVDTYDATDLVNPCISMQPSSGNWPQIIQIVSGNKYNVADLNQSSYTVAANNKITVFTGRFKSTKKTPSSTYWTGDADANSVTGGSYHPPHLIGRCTSQ